MVFFLQKFAENMGSRIVFRFIGCDNIGEIVNFFRGLVIFSCLDFINRQFIQIFVFHNPTALLFIFQFLADLICDINIIGQFSFVFRLRYNE